MLPDRWPFVVVSDTARGVAGNRHSRAGQQGLPPVERINRGNPSLGIDVAVNSPRSISPTLTDMRFPRSRFERRLEQRRNLGGMCGGRIDSIGTMRLIVNRRSATAYLEPRVEPRHILARIGTKRSHWPEVFVYANQGVWTAAGMAGGNMVDGTLGAFGRPFSRIVGPIPYDS